MIKIYSINSTDSIYSIDRIVDALGRLALFRSIVRLSRLGLNHNGGIAALVELGFVADGADDIARLQAEGCSEGGEGGDEHREDDFDDLGFSHSGSVF